MNKIILILFNRMRKMIIQNLEAEQSLIGSLLIDNTLVQELDIKAEAFNSEVNKIIFKTILKLIESNQTIDLITVKSELEKNGTLHKIGGMSYLAELTEVVPTSSNFASYQDILKELYILKNLNNLSNLISDNINSSESSENIIGNIYKELDSLEGEKINKGIYDILSETQEYIEKIKKQELLGNSFGSQFDWLDKMTGGLQAGIIVRIGGGSNVGKSWLMYNILLSILYKDDRITFFALENSDSFTMKNLLGLKKGENSLPEYIRKKELDYTEELGWFYDKKNFFLDSTHNNLNDIFRITLKNKSKFIFIDYIGLVNIPGKFVSDVQKFAYYSSAIQAFAKKHKITVIDLSQLSNETQKEGVYGKGSSEFKGGGDLKASADVGIHIYEDIYRTEAKESEISNGDTSNFFVNYVLLKLSKNRLGGGVGITKQYELNFNKGGKYLLNDF